MFFFSKKTTIAASGILQGATDHHSHILPGVDDGVETMDEALRILATYEAAGIKTLWLTPHIMEDIPNTPQKLKARFAELQAAYTGNITLHLAAEYMIDNHLRKLLQETTKLRPASEGVVLPEAFLETPPRFRGEVVEDRRGEKSPKERPQGSIVNPYEVTEGSKATSTKLCPAFEGVVLPEALQETPPRFRGEVDEDRRGEKNPKEYPIGTTEESKTKNCPSSRGTSITSDAEGVETNKLCPAFEGRWHEQSEVTEGSKTKNCPSFKRGTSNTGNIAQEVQDNNNSPSSKREYPQGEGVEKKSIAEGVELLPIGSKGNHLLVETSYYNPPMRFRETLRQIKSLGYHPLLAHPERYMYMDNDEYRELHDEGVRFQLNLPSLCGAYGNTVKKRALWLLKNGLYDAIGSDTHCEAGAVFLLERKFDKQTIGQVEHLLHNSI